MSETSQGAKAWSFSGAIWRRRFFCNQISSFNSPAVRRTENQLKDMCVHGDLQPLPGSYRIKFIIQFLESTESKISKDTLNVIQFKIRFTHLIKNGDKLPAGQRYALPTVVMLSLCSPKVLSKLFKNCLKVISSCPKVYSKLSQGLGCPSAVHLHWDNCKSSWQSKKLQRKASQQKSSIFEGVLRRIAKTTFCFFCTGP